jgi:ribonuclease P protein component
MEQERRLRSSQDIVRALKQGRSWATPFLVLRSAANGLSMTRFGFVVSRRVGGAVVRNRVKRRLREAARRTPVQEGWDLVFIAREPAASADYRSLEAAMGALLRRARLLPPSSQEHGERQ